MNKTHICLKMLFFLILLAITASCASTPVVKNPPLRIAYTQWWGDYTLIIAKEKGFFAKYGVEVEPIYYDVFSKALTDIASGQIDGSTMTINDAILVNSHVGLSGVAIIDDGGTSVIVAKPEIKSVSDLKGKNIGVTTGSNDELMVSEMLLTVGMKIEDVTLVNVNPESIPDGLNNGTIQAGFTWEPYTSQSKSLGNHILFSSNEISGLLPDIIVFPTRVTTQRPMDIKNFLKAWFDAVDFRTKNPQEANHLIAFRLNLPVDQITGDAKLMTLDNNLDYFSVNPKENIRSIYDIAKLNADYLVKSGSVTNIPNIKQLLDPSFLTK
jgi:NitT/TauT family transport system substrate-binding protein